MLLCLPRGGCSRLVVVVVVVVVLCVLCCFCTGLSMGVHCIHVWKCVLGGVVVGGMLLFVPVVGCLFWFLSHVEFGLPLLVVLASRHVGNPISPARSGIHTTPIKARVAD